MAVFPKTFPPGKGQILYAKSKVYIHLTSSKKDNVVGYLVIVKPFADSTNTDFIVAFIPETDVSADDRQPLDYFDLYGLDGERYDFYSSNQSSQSQLSRADGQDKDKDKPKIAKFINRPKTTSMTSFAFGMPISNLYSIQVRPKTTTLWEGSVVFHPKDVLEKVPALFFHDDESPGTKREQKLRSKQFTPFAENSKGDLYWGGDRFISCLKNYCVLEESTLEKGMYMVNPSKEDMINFIPNVLDDKDLLKRAKNGEPVSVSDSINSVGRTVGDFITNAKWKMLTGLASVTTFAKKQLNDISENQSIPNPIRKMFVQPQVQAINEDFDSANIYLAKWALAVQEEADKSRKKIVGNDYYKHLVETQLGSGTVQLTPQEVSHARRLKPVSKVEWNSKFDSYGMLQITVREVLDRIFHGGVDPEVRNEAWLFLLNVYPWDTSADERKQLKGTFYDSYIEYKNSWKGNLSKQKDDEHWKDQKARIEKDVRRTDRELEIYGGNANVSEEENEGAETSSMFINEHLSALRDILFTYNELNSQLGYVQGMSDLLSPLYYVIRDEPLTFWAFARFMEFMERNFVSDLSGMKDQMLTLMELVQFMMPTLYEHLDKCDSGNLFFFFRMLLVWFKRELSFDDTMRLWEVLWTNFYSSQFVLFFCLAILEKNSKIIMSTLNRFDDILRYMNDLSGTLDVDDLLIRAELLFLKFKQMVELIDRRNSGLGASNVNNKPKEKTIVSPQLRLLLSQKPILKTEADVDSGTSKAKPLAQSKGQITEVAKTIPEVDKAIHEDNKTDNKGAPEIDDQQAEDTGNPEQNETDKSAVPKDYKKSINAADGIE